MKFFTQFAQLLKTHNVNMTMSYEDSNIMTIAIFPKAKTDISNVSQGGFPPLIISGTPEELDESFFTKVVEMAMQKTGGIITNIKFFATEMKKKEEEAKNKTEAKELAKKEADKKKADKKDIPPVVENKKSAEVSLFSEEEQTEKEEA